jgi:murein DD-endopeptidase MepM/ murein hydrolase activator NlpD
MKAQFPIDGVPGKAWKVKSKMGWRIHPVKNEKKHHNGTDIIPGSIKGKVYIEAAFDGKVMYAGPSKAKKANGEPDGFGYYVKIASQINGEWYSHLYAHLDKGSLQVKTGQKVTAGTVLGVMGTTGMSTGVHLHWEIWKGKDHGWSADGKGFVEPIEFTKSVIAAQKAAGYAKEATPEDAPVADDGIKPAAKPAVKAATKPVAKPAVAKSTPKPAAKAVAKAKTHKVVSGDTLSKIAAKHGTTVAALTKLNGIKNANSISVGQVIKLS